MSKSADAFRTISEVADWLDTPAHVLRFWESKFTQVKPVKRAGGRRYYRPADMLLLGGIKKLLHEDGLTIKGVQKILRDQGIRHVTAFSQPLDEVTEAEVSAIAQDVSPENATATVLHFQRETDSAGDPVPDMTQDTLPAATDSPSEATLEAVEDTDAMPDTGTNAPLEHSETLDEIQEVPRNETEQGAEFETPPDSGRDAADQSPAPPDLQSAHQGEAAVARTTTPQESTPAVATSPKVALPPLGIPDDPDDGTAAAPGLLAALADLRGPLAAEQAQALRDLVTRLKSIGA